MSGGAVHAQDQGKNVTLLLIYLYKKSASRQQKCMTFQVVMTLNSTLNNKKFYPVQWESKGEETNFGGNMTFKELLISSVCEIAYLFKHTLCKREVLYSKKALLVTSF